MDDSISVIETIEEDKSEELIEATEPVEIFNCNSLPDNMEATKLAEEIEIESKSPRVSEESEQKLQTRTKNKYPHQLQRLIELIIMVMVVMETVIFL